MLNGLKSSVIDPDTPDMSQEMDCLTKNHGNTIVLGLIYLILGLLVVIHIHLCLLATPIDVGRRINITLNEPTLGPSGNKGLWACLNQMAL